MFCRHCGSENIRRFQVICEEGTSTESFSATSTPKWNTKPFTPQGKAKIQGTRTVKTELTKRCSPPADPEAMIFYLAAFPGMIIGGYLGFSSGISWNSFWLGLIVFVIALFAVIFGSLFLWKRFIGGHRAIENYRKNLDAWHRSWHCSKCGGVTVAGSA